MIPLLCRADGVAHDQNGRLRRTGSLDDGTHVVAVRRPGAGSKVDKYFLYRYEPDR